MMLEVLVRWTEFKTAEGLDDFESTPKFQASYDISPMVIDVNDIKRFNKANEKGYTTIRFDDGDGCVIKYDFDSFSEVYSEMTGKSITRLIEETIDPDNPMDDDDDII